MLTVQKHFILNNLKMQDVLDKYNIKTIKGKFCCPFHNDRTPSAKAYDNSFFCFACNKGGDVIQFVQDYFNISFIDAIKKINKDFNLNLQNTKMSIDELKKLAEETRKKRLEKERKEREYRSKMLNLCNTSRILEKAREDIKSCLNPYNWEEIEETCALLTEQIELLDMEFEKMNVRNH